MVPPLRVENLKIVLKFGEGQADAEEAHFYYVTVWNRGRKTAKNVVPHVTLSNPAWRKVGLMPLLIISRPAFPIYLIDQTGTIDDKTDPDRFADALVRTESLRKDAISLYGEGLPETFILFFTVKGSKVLWVPTTGPGCAFAICPEQFNLALYLQGRDMPAKRVGSYFIHARDWDEVRVLERGDQ